MFRFVSLLCLLLLCVNLFAQSKLDSIQNLQTVTITVNRYKEVIPSQKLSGVELETLNSFSVADAIRYFSGVQIKDYGGIGGLKTVDIRSMGTNHIGVFYDGIQLGNAQNGQIDLGKFSLDNIEEIALYNGQKSEIFQSAKDFGSSGSIYLRTRRPRFEDGKKTNITSFFRTGSFGLINPSVLWEQKLSENISSSLNAEYIYADGKYKYNYVRYNSDGSIANDTTATRKNGDIQAFRLEGGLNGYRDNGRWNLKAYFYNSERGIPGAIINSNWENPQRQWDRNFFTQASFLQKFSERYELLINGKYANDYMHYLNKDSVVYDDNENAELNLKTMYIDNYFRQQEYYFSAANKYSLLPQWDISLSIDYQRNLLDSELTFKNYIYPKRHTLLVAAATAFEWNRLKVQASLLGTFISEKSKKVQVDYDKGNSIVTYYTPPDKEEYTPALFLSYKPFSRYDFSLRAFYKRIFRMPTFNDLYYADIDNINLNPEYTTQYNFGFQYNKTNQNSILKSFNFSSDVYYNQVTDKIVAIPKGSGQYRWMMMNIGYVKIRGVDMNAELVFLLSHNISIQTNLSYTFQKAQDYTESDNGVDAEANPYKGQIAYIPEHSGSFVASALYKSWNLNYSFIYVGERYHNSSNIRENYEPSWYTHDITVGKEFNHKNIKFRLSGEINNVFNQFYEVVYNYPMPGRNYKLILKIEI